LGLAIGASTAVFSVVENTIFEPFPYQGQSRLAVIHVRDLDSPEDWHSFFTIPEIQEFTKENHVFEGVAANLQDDIIRSGPEGSVRFVGNYALPGSFELLGMPALLGRGLEPPDFQPDAPPVFVLRYKTWQTKFGGDASAIGKTFTLS